MEDYVDESIEVCKDESFGEAYDKEWAIMDEYERIGLQKGIEQSKIEIAKNLLKTSLSVEEIANATGLNLEEIENLK